MGSQVRHLVLALGLLLALGTQISRTAGRQLERPSQQLEVPANQDAPRSGHELATRRELASAADEVASVVAYLKSNGYTTFATWFSTRLSTALAQQVAKGDSFTVLAFTNANLAKVKYRPWLLCEPTAGFFIGQHVLTDKRTSSDLTPDHRGVLYTSLTPVPVRKASINDVKPLQFVLTDGLGNFRSAKATVLKEDMFSTAHFVLHAIDVPLKYPTGTKNC